jgi:hypothetical protein
MSESVAIALISAGIGGLLTPLILKLTDSILRRKTERIDSASKLTSSALALIDQHEQDVTELRNRIVELERKDAKRKEEVLKLTLRLSQAQQRISVLENENSVLRGQLEKHVKE